MHPRPYRSIKTFIISTLVILFLISLATKTETAFAANAVTPSLTADLDTSACPAFKTSHIYCMLAPLGSFFPGNVDIANKGLSGYLNSLYKLGVALATGLALIYITLGGVQYASTDAIEGKSEGKAMIGHALAGLLLVLASYIILGAINTQFLNDDLVLQGNVTLGTITGNGSVTNDPPPGSGNGANGTSVTGGGAGYPTISAQNVQYAPGPGNNIVGDGTDVAVDFDGSPGAYKLTEDPNGKYVINGKTYSSTGYEDAQNACLPHCFDGTKNAWYGVQTDSSGNPIINSDGTLNGQLSYGTGKINGDTDAFVAINNTQLQAIKNINPNFKYGDQLILTNPSNGKSVYAVAADYGGNNGNSTHIEASPAAFVATGTSYGKNPTTGKSGADGHLILSVPK